MSRGMGSTVRLSLAWLAAVTALQAGPACAITIREQEEPVAESVNAQGTQVAEDPQLEAEVERIARRLRCPTCRALSVEDSPSGIAQEMRGLIREQLKAGKTPEEITAYFVDRYGEWILLKPKASGFNWTVWLLPIALLAGGFLFVMVTARRWVQKGQARAEALTEASSQND